MSPSAPPAPGSSPSPHVYDYSVDPSSDTAPARVCRMVGRDKRVLEIGAGPGSITRVLTGQGNRVTALEVDDSALPLLRPHCERVIAADLNRAGWPDAFGSERFDAVVAADVLEHLTDPWSTVGRARTLLAPGGSLVVSVPHASHACVVACLLDENVRYGDWGLLDRTHIRFFGLRNVEAMFREQQMKIVRAEFVVRAPGETELAAHFAALPWSTRLMLSAQPFSHVYQVVVAAAPEHDPRQAVDLMKLDQRSFSGQGRGALRAVRAVLRDTLPR